MSSYLLYYKIPSKTGGALDLNNLEENERNIEL
jgi:hypothetical protein